MRIRTVKPDYFTDEHVTRLSHTARLLYISMWCQADDRGRLDDAPKRICANAFGEGERVHPEKLIGALATGPEPRILRYEAHGKSLIAIRWFRLHQVISKPQDSRLPPPPLSDESIPFQGWTREEFQSFSRKHSRTATGTGQESFQERSIEEWNGRGMEEEEEVEVAPEGPARRRNPIFDALCEACGMDPAELTQSEAKRVGVKSAELAKLRPPPDRAEILRRGSDEIWVAVMGDATKTPAAIVTNWARLNGNPRASPRRSSAVDLLAQSKRHREEEEEREAQRGRPGLGVPQRGLSDSP